MVLSFNSMGYLANGKHVCTIEEFKQFYVKQFSNSTSRNRIFENFVNVINTLLGFGLKNVKLWIDGSYTTNKINPGDIDFCLVVDSVEIENLDDDAKKALRNFGTNAFHDFLKKYDCDFYFVIDSENNPAYPAYYECMRIKKYWNDWWSHDRNGIEKGFVELEVKGGVIQ